MPQQKLPKGKADMWVEGVEPPPVSKPSAPAKERQLRTYKPKILTDYQKKLRTLQKT